MNKYVKKHIVFALLAVFGLFFVFPGFYKAESDERGAGWADEKTVYRLPIIMYHAVVPDRYRADAYTIKISDLKRDLDYIKAEGYTAVLPRDLTAFVYEGRTLPAKPIMLTFDDGFYGVKSLAFEELEKRGQRAVCAVVGKYMDEEEKADRRVIYSYLNYSDVLELHSSGIIEIASHSDNLHSLKKRKGIKKMPSEGQEQYKKMLVSDTLALHDKLGKIGIKPMTYAFPFGIYDKHSNSILKELDYKVTFNCREGVNLLVREKDCLYGLKRFNRSGTGKSAAAILKKFDKY